MAYNTKYQFDFYDVDGNPYRVLIQKNAYSGSIININPASSPFTLSYKDNDEELITPIRASEATIKIISNSNFSLLNIISDNVKDYLISLQSINIVNNVSYINTIWTGFLDSSSSYESMVDDPKFVTLKATDGLGLLKNVPFKDNNGNEIYETKITLLQAISYIITKTDLQIKLNIGINVFEETQANRLTNAWQDPLSQTYIHASAFMDSNFDPINCYDALMMILNGFNATIFQANGEWYIIRFPDRWNNSVANTQYFTVYNYPYAAYTTYSYWEGVHSIGLGQNLNAKPINVDHQRKYLNPIKGSKVEFTYKMPSETPANSSFKRGVPLPNHSANGIYTVQDENNNNVQVKRKVYSIFNWTTYDGDIPNQYVSSNGHYRVEETNVEEFISSYKDSFLVIPLQSYDPSHTVKRVVNNEKIEVSKFDRLNFSVQTKSSSDTAVYVVIYGLSGQKYTLDDDSTWHPTANDQPGVALGTNVDVQSNANEWLEVSYVTKPFPEDGHMYIWLVGYTPLFGGDYVYFKNLKLSFEVMSNKGKEVAIVEQNTSNIEIYSKKIEIGNSISKSVYGALFRSTNQSQLQRYWYQLGKAEQKRLIEILARDLFRLRKRVKMTIDGSIYGIVGFMPGNSTKRIILSPFTLFSYEVFQNSFFLSTNIDLDIESNEAKLSLFEFYNTLLDNPDEQGDSQKFEIVSI